MDWQALIDVLKGHVVYIQTHNFPDPDAIASAFGLQTFLKYHEVDAEICYIGKIEKLSSKRMLDIFSIDMQSADEITDMQETDYIVTVDGQKNNSNFADLSGTEVACIDHHPTVIPCTYQYKDVRITGACASLVTEYFKVSNTPMDQNTATALLYGIRMDTDSFNRGVTALDIEMFGYLNERADRALLQSMKNNVMELEDLRAYGEAIQNIHIYDNVGFASISFECPEALVAMISDFILGLDVVEVSIVHALREDGIKFSVRSEITNIHAGVLIREALKGLGDGGGHAVMAGGFIPMKAVDTLENHFEYEIHERFLAEIRRQKGLIQS